MKALEPIDAYPTHQIAGFDVRAGGTAVRGHPVPGRRQLLHLLQPRPRR